MNVRMSCLAVVSGVVVAVASCAAWAQGRSARRDEPRRIGRGEPARPAREAPAPPREQRPEPPKPLVLRFEHISAESFVATLKQLGRNEKVREVLEQVPWAVNGESNSVVFLAPPELARLLTELAEGLDRPSEYRQRQHAREAGRRPPAGAMMPCWGPPCQQMGERGAGPWQSECPGCPFGGMWPRMGQRWGGQERPRFGLGEMWQRMRQRWGGGERGWQAPSPRPQERPMPPGPPGRQPWGTMPWGQGLRGRQPWGMAPWGGQQGWGEPRWGQHRWGEGRREGERPEWKPGEGLERKPAERGEWKPGEKPPFERPPFGRPNLQRAPVPQGPPMHRPEGAPARPEASPRRGPVGPGPGAMVERLLARPMIEALRLEEGQVDRIRHLLEERREQFAGARQRLERALREAGDNARRREEVLRGIRQHVEESMREMRQSISRILTPQQREKLEQMMREQGFGGPPQAAPSRRGGEQRRPAAPSEDRRRSRRADRDEEGDNDD